MGYFSAVPGTDADSACIDENRPLQYRTTGKGSFVLFSVKKSSVELQKCNLLCFTILYLKDSTNVINSLKELNIAAGQCAPLKTCECFTLQL